MDKKRVATIGGAFEEAQKTMAEVIAKKQLEGSGAVVVTGIQNAEVVLEYDIDLTDCEPPFIQKPLKRKRRKAYFGKYR